MHRLAARVRKLERKLPELDISDFTDEDLTELVRLLIRHHFRTELSWAQGYFLTHSRRAQKAWCKFVDSFSDLSPEVIREWFDVRARPMVSYYPGTEPGDVTVVTYKKLLAQIGIWERLIRQPDWPWLFRTANAVRLRSLNRALMPVRPEESF